MTAASTRALAGPRAAFGLSLGFVLAALTALGGGIGVAAASCLAAIAALPRPALWARLFRREPALLAGAAFIVWISLSQLWSPATLRQLSIVWLEVFLYTGLLLAAAALPEARRLWPRRILVGSMLVLALGMSVEALTGGVFTAAAKGVAPGDPTVLGNLGRGASAQIILTGPAAVVAWRMGGRWRWAAGALAAGAAIAALGLDTLANIVALVMAAALLGLAWRWPRVALLALAGGIVAWLAVFPLAVEIAAPLSSALRASIPYSWEWRLEAWSYALELMEQKPLTGWGMDSARHFREAVELRGNMLPRMPLHPHSASLQIWLETGLVGVVALCTALGAGGMRIAAAHGLDRDQAAAAAAAAGAVLAGVMVSYGVWQEWLCGAAVLAAAACLLAGRGPEPGSAAR